MGADGTVRRVVRVCWVADDDDEASHVGAARPPGVPPLEVDWTRTVPDLAELGGYDLLVVDPGALRLAPDALEHHVHADLPSLPIVFYSGLRPEHHLRALMRERPRAHEQPGHRLVWAMPSLVHWIAHGEYPLTDRKSVV